MPVVTNGLFDLNCADRKLLTQLPCISKDVAYRIINYRNQHGGFSDWSDVETATGLSPTRIAALKGRAFLGPRPQPVTNERKIISRWKGKANDELHEHG